MPKNFFFGIIILYEEKPYQFLKFCTFQIFNNLLVNFEIKLLFNFLKR